MSFIILMMLYISLIFLFLSHPVSISVTIFFQVIMIALLCGLISHLMWFSYMLFLIMIGGLLILFMYMTNVASNEKFKPSKYIKILSIMLVILSPLTFMIDKFYSFSIKTTKMNLNFDSLETILMKFYNFPSMNIFMLMMIFLLMTMIMSVKLTNVKKGALRQKA